MPSASKKVRLEDLPLPPEPPSGLVVPNVPYIESNSLTSTSKIYYPSQDPQRLGAKGDVID